MSEIIFRGSAVAHSKTRTFAFFLVIGLTGVLCSSGLLVAARRLPSNAVEVAAYVGFPSLLMLMYSGWHWISNRGDIFLTKGKNNSMGITILSAGRKKMVELFSPFVIQYGCQLIDPGRGPRTYRMFMVFRDEEENCLLALESGRSEAFGVPEGWNEITDDQLGELLPHYDVSHLLELAKPLRKFMQ